jgi:AraC-like DNA-binding protein
MEHLAYTLLDGGIAQCTPLWNSHPNGRDRCYKLYFPQEGNARVLLNDTWHSLDASKIYFINGYQLQRNFCESSMSVIWLHFVPESLYLNALLSKMPAFFEWDLQPCTLDFFDPTVIISFFSQSTLFSTHNQLKDSIPFEKSLRLYGLLSLLLSDFIAKTPYHAELHFQEHMKIKASLDFIEKNYTQNLTLAEMASPSYLNPSYFLRLFKQIYNQTPHDYLMSLKLHSACLHLKRTNKSLRDISDTLGFCNQFHFSKVFKAYYGIAPSIFRNKNYFI